MEANLIGYKIARARKKMNISQATLAGRLFLSPQAIGKWERGESLPDIVTVARLAELLEVELNYFSDSFDPASATTPEQTPIEKSGEQEPNPEAIPDAAGRRLLTDFGAGNLAASDFAGVIAHNSKFEASNLSGADFSNADLTGSSFKVGDARAANFDGANLTDCNFTILDLGNAHFHKTQLVRTVFDKTGLAGVTFSDITWIDVRLNMIDLRTTVLERCVFNGVDFKHCDLRGACLDGLTFTGVRFDRTALEEATFKGAVFKNVSFVPAFALTNKYYRAIKNICFDGALMDKLTYAALKGIGADLAKVTIH